MRLSVRIEEQPAHDPAGPGSRTRDVRLVTAAPDVTVGDLLDHLAGPLTARVAAGELTIEVDGTEVPGATRLADLPLWAGSELSVRPAAPGTPAGPSGGGPVGRPVVELSRVAGPDSGQSIALDHGTFAIGRRRPAGLDFGTVTRALVHIETTDQVRVAAVDDGCPVRVDGRDLTDDESDADLHDGSYLRLGDTAFRVAPPAEVPSPPPWPAPWTGEAPGGREPLIRTPRVATTAPAEQVPVPAAPAPVATPAPLSWLLLIAPLPIGVVMAFVFSPFFLVMVAMTPLMALARWVESRHRAKKDTIRLARESAAAVQRFGTDLDATRTAVAAAARAAYPGLAGLVRRAVSGRGLWEVRPGDADELRVVIGVGARPWFPELGRRGTEELTGRPELGEALAERSRLPDVPIHVNLRDRTGLGVVGTAAHRAAAAVVLDLVTRHGPADLAVALVVQPDRLARWDWLKWLPHLSGDDGTLRVAADPATTEQLLTRLAADTAPPSRTALIAGGAGTERTGATHTVVVVDGDDLVTGRVASMLGRLARGSGRTLVVSGHTERLPSVCQCFLELTQDGTADLTDAVTGERTPGLLAVRAADQVCAPASRALARWTDPEQAVAAAMLPSHARLVDLLRTVMSGPDGLGQPVEDLDPLSVGEWWRRGTCGMQATIGLTEHGPLTVDLHRDGPHGLVVGTTGAGKSEFLRTVVASLACAHSPDALTFLLVDFKGGGAFDACAALPHTVGLVTDLDEHLAARALRCLRAELRHRERRLREAGVSDIDDLVAPDPPLPRLLIVIDEFATLAVELPGFLGALVDVAQRGRSLGIHLLLATQRPQGVVDGKIRANTNLRVALRVQDEADSRDVLGTRQAADIDRHRPGRAYVRLGAGEVVGVQTALVSAATRRGPRARIEVAPFALLTEQVTDVREDQPDGVPTDLERLVSVLTQAAERGGYPRPRVPCPPPLPQQVDAWSLAADIGATADGPLPVPLGLVDLPDEQRSDVWCWAPEAGGTLVLGADATATGAVLATACLSLARHRAPDRQRIFVLEGLGTGLGALAGLPHVSAAVGVDDSERLARVLDQMDAEIARRRVSRAASPDVLLVVAGWDALVEGAERTGVGEVGARLERLLRDGAPVGIRLLISASHDRGVPGRVLAQLPTKLCLRLADANSYTGLGLRARDVPELTGLRAIDLQTRREVQIGRHCDARPGALADAVARVVADYPDAVPAPTVTVLPELVPAGEVLSSSAAGGPVWRLGIGRHYRDLSVATLALGPGMHAVVAGPAGSGRTGTLRLLATAARASAPDARVLVVAADPDAWTGTQGTEVSGSFSGLTSQPSTGRALLLVDGIESLPDAGPALDRLLPGLPAGVHVVVAGRPDAFRGMQPWQRAVTMSRTGLLLRPAPDDGEVLRVRLPREAPPRPLPGRGYLVEAGGLAQVQVAFVAPPSPGAPLAVPVGVFAGEAR
ncbi:FtsK/SpoIIIE domain-containing protein [Verrucosispora sp. WMMC514]|uniref:FtsK/SpoIIIE domain-containing protein n=1 Tax=Verrucosispora sp. WMMC514 TaxID=3015156 RepID=UPI00248CEAEC|nr:FtsK/SpoIIIE domain-containing protein [Verrucosispora sp. WMMC514]WBB91241.1 FtsK/SpoIIIE domain-containing protein [Verrucosispora sp. WMMC514]